MLFLFGVWVATRFAKICWYLMTGMQTLIVTLML